MRDVASHKRCRVRCATIVVVVGLPRPEPAAVAAAVVVSCSSGLLLATRPDRIIGYSAGSPTAATAYLVPGAVLAAVAVVASRVMPGRWGLPAAATSIGWLAQIWVGWQDGPPLLRSTAEVAGAFVAPAILHLAFMAVPDSSRLRRAVIIGGYGVVAVLSVARALVRDPFYDRYCWSNCTDNSFLVVNLPRLAREFERGMLVATFAVAITTAGWGALTWWRHSRAARVDVWPMLATTAFAGVAEATYAALRLFDAAEGPTKPVFRVVFEVRSGALAGVAAGIAAAITVRKQRRRRLNRLVTEISDVPAPGWLRDTLARSLADPGLVVVFRLPDTDNYVDAYGRAADATASRDRARTTIVRNGDPVAIVVHDPRIGLDEEAVEAIGAAARLAVDNERFRASLLSRADDVRASRARIVAAADAARRRLERDLHDGAQQRLLAAGYALRLASETATDRGDADLAARLDAAVAETRLALGELRDVAHGIFPAILDNAGLSAALEELAEVAPVAVGLRALPDRPVPGPVATATYFLVQSAIEASTHTDHGLQVSARVTDGRLVVEIDGARADGYVRASDRVAALGGRLRVMPGRVEAELPCE